jgi:hypothetical protein
MFSARLIQAQNPDDSCHRIYCLKSYCVCFEIPWFILSILQTLDAPTQKW